MGFFGLRLGYSRVWIVCWWFDVWMEGEKKGVWIKEQGSKLKDGNPIVNKQMIILLYIDFIGYANFPPFFIAFN